MESKRVVQIIATNVGFAGGIFYSVANKTGFWKGFGITLLASIALGSVGFSIDYALAQKNKS